MKFQEDMAVCKELLSLGLVLCFGDDTHFPGAPKRCYCSVQKAKCAMGHGYVTIH